MYTHIHVYIYIYIYIFPHLHFNKYYEMEEVWTEKNPPAFHIFSSSDLISYICFGHLFLMQDFFILFIFLFSLFYDVHIDDMQLALIAPETSLCRVLQLHGSEA